DYFVGDEYSIADVAIYPWLITCERQGQDMNDFPNLYRWFEQVGSRPAVQRGLAVGEELRRPIEEIDKEARNRLFGNTGRS
ncbi:MAG: glutathione binding-like protein, partial [Actinomycetota bacterium]|nr:glutathione binding-like protein [Actinomycetota bacterium]